MRNRLSAFLHLQGCLLLLLGQAPFGFAQEQIFQVDSANSEVAFEVSNMGFLTVKGNFHRFEGSFLMQNKQLVSIEGKIEVSSFSTKDKNRDKTVKGEAYLDADSFPFIQFQSTMVDSDAQEIIGDLTIKGVSQSIKMPYTSQPTKKENAINLSMTTRIDRKDFELDFGPMDSLIGDEISIRLKILGKK